MGYRNFLSPSVSPSINQSMDIHLLSLMLILLLIRAFKKGDVSNSEEEDAYDLGGAQDGKFKKGEKPDVSGSHDFVINL